MINLAIKFFLWLRQTWETLDEETKRKIIKAILEAFEDALRAFYRYWKGEVKDEAKT
ncbi:hypothetical protein [Methylomicrobium lacus]|uniref:hypothetical protein n=1 Tax=Methylomicrobium lacus TaxID=136992 RepID=UPI0035A98A06